MAFIDAQMLFFLLFLASASAGSVIIVPDTQYDVLGNDAREFRTAMRWAKLCSSFHDAVAVLGLGDITHTQTAQEWRRAASAVSPLYLHPPVPAVFARGNHDNGTGYRDLFWRENKGWHGQQHPFLQNESSPLGFYETDRVAVVVLDSFYVDAEAYSRTLWNFALHHPSGFAVLVDHRTRCDDPTSACHRVTKDQPVPDGVTAVVVGGHERMYSQYASSFRPATTGGEILEITLNFQTTDSALSRGKTFGGALGIVTREASAVTMRTYSPVFESWVRTTFSEFYWGRSGQPVPLALPSDTVDGDFKCGTELVPTDPLFFAVTLGLGLLAGGLATVAAILYVRAPIRVKEN